MTRRSLYSRRLLAAKTNSDTECSHTVERIDPAYGDHPVSGMDLHLRCSAPKTVTQVQFAYGQ